jgi:hypothetical protein
MVRNCIDFTSSLVSLLENWLKVLRNYFSQTWRSIHPIVNARGSDKITVGVACGRWHARPNVTMMAEVMDIIEEHGSPEHVKALGTYLQRACALDDDMRRDLLAVAESLVMLGDIQKSYNAYALNSLSELRLVIAGCGKVEEIKCHPLDLFALLWSVLQNREISIPDTCILADEIDTALI